MNSRKIGLRHLARWVLIAAVASMLGGCGDDKSESKAKEGAAVATTQKETRLYFDGVVHGSVDDKAFTFSYKEGKNAAVSTRGDVREFTIKFVADGNIVVIIINQYQGTGSYDKELHVIWQRMKNVGKLLTLKDKRVLLEETPTGVLSDFMIIGETAEHKQIKIIGTFKLKKREV